MTNNAAGALSRRHFLMSSAAFGATAAAMPAFAQAADFDVPAGLPAPDGPMRWLDTGGQKGEFHKIELAAYGAAAGIDVVYDGLPWAEVGKVLPLGIRNGSAPDSFCLPQNMEGAVAVNESWVQPIEDYIPDFETWKQAYPDGSFIEGVNVFDRNTYGFPYGTRRRFDNAILFDQDKMNAVGYDHIGPDRALTFDEFRDAAAKITQTGTPGFIIGGKQVTRWGGSVTSLAQRGGAKVGTAGLLEGLNFETGEYDYASDEYVQAVELLLAMRDDGSVFPGVMNLIAPQARDFMTQGAAGLIIQGPWNVPIWQQTAPAFNFGVSPLAAPDESAAGKPLFQPTLVQTGNMMYLNREAKNPGYVGGYFRWLGTLEGQIAYANVGTCADPALFPETTDRAAMTPREQAMIRMADDLVRIHPNPFVRNAAVAKVAATYIDPTPNLSQAVQGLFAGQLSGVRETLQGVADARNKALDEAIAKARAEGAEVSRDDFVFSNWDGNTDYGPADYAAL